MSTKSKKAVHPNIAINTSDLWRLTPMQLADALAKHLDAKGFLRVQASVALFPVELVALCRKAIHRGCTVNDLIDEFISEGHDGVSGILETLHDYENALPKAKA